MGRTVRHDARMGPAVRQVVRRRQAQRRLQLRRSPRRERPRRQGRLPLDRRARRHADDHLRRSAARGEQGGQRAARARHPDRRPGRDLHADDPGAADRDARLRPDRRAAHGRLRRLLRRGARRPHRGFPGQAGHHRGRRLAPRQAGDLKPAVDEALLQTPDRSSTCSSCDASATPSRRGRPMTEGRDVWWHDIVDRQSAEHTPGPGRLRAHALPALHVGHDRQAEGHPPHERRLPARHGFSPTGRSSTSSRTTCTGARPTSAG